MEQEIQTKVDYSMKDLKPVGVKAPLSLLPRGPLCAISAAIEHGAVKYAPWNWQDENQPQAQIAEFHSALLRHTLASSDPSQGDYDEESGLHHLAHAGACVMIMLWKLGIDYKPSKFITNPPAEETPIVDPEGCVQWEGKDIPVPVFSMPDHLKSGDWNVEDFPVLRHEDEDPNYLLARKLAKEAFELYNASSNVDEVARRLYQFFLDDEGDQIARNMAERG